MSQPFMVASRDGFDIEVTPATAVGPLLVHHSVTTPGWSVSEAASGRVVLEGFRQGPAHRIAITLSRTWAEVAGCSINPKAALRSLVLLHLSRSGRGGGPVEYAEERGRFIGSVAIRDKTVG
jgi:hypothetical protein